MKLYLRVHLTETVWQTRRTVVAAFIILLLSYFLSEKHRLRAITSEALCIYGWIFSGELISSRKYVRSLDDYSSYYLPFAKINARAITFEFEKNILVKLHKRIYLIETMCCEEDDNSCFFGFFCTMPWQNFVSLPSS